MQIRCSWTLGKIISTWKFSEDFSEEVALLKSNLEVRVKFGKEGLLLGDGGRWRTKEGEGFSSCSVCH